MTSKDLLYAISPEHTFVKLYQVGAERNVDFGLLERFENKSYRVTVKLTATDYEFILLFCLVESKSRIGIECKKTVYMNDLEAEFGEDGIEVRRESQAFKLKYEDLPFIYQVRDDIELALYKARCEALSQT